jgi:hypothetical protein
MPDGVEAGEDKFRVNFVNTRYKGSKSKIAVEMKYTQTFGKAIKKFCQITGKTESDYKFTCTTYANVSVTDTPGGMQMFQKLTIKYTRLYRISHNYSTPPLRYRKTRSGREY